MLFWANTHRGFSTVNAVIPLSDGAELWLAIGVQPDRYGKEYVSGFAPDEVIERAKQVMQPSRDPVVLAAVSWLNHYTLGRPIRSKEGYRFFLNLRSSLPKHHKSIPKRSVTVQRLVGPLHCRKAP